MQHQLSPNLSVEAAYVGNKGTDMFAGERPDYELNSPSLVGFADGVSKKTDARRPFFDKFGWTQGFRYFGTNSRLVAGARGSRREFALTSASLTRTLGIGPARSADSYLDVLAGAQRGRDHRRRRDRSRVWLPLRGARTSLRSASASHIKFIGPAPNVIRLLGDKARARRAMKKAGIPILPGSDGPVDGEEKALKIAQGPRLSGD